MSTNIDDRIVEMRFDNKQFEKGANESIKTLEKLRENLKLENAEQGFERISKASKSLSLDHVGDAIEAVRDKFSVLGTFADQVIRNIANGFTDLVGKAGQFIKSMSIDQIAGGWNQYQSKIQSVQTMMMALPGTSEEQINKALDKLTWYGDETSYSVEQMVDAVSKFTGAGAGLDESVLAAQGIAGWLATAGVNAQRAGSAFYNLSQAMGAGALTVNDYKSLEGLNATTSQFKQNLIEAGLAMGTLERSGENVVVAGTKMVVTAEGLRETLSKRWVTKDVMLQTFAKYGEFSDQLYDLYNAAENTDSTSDLIDKVTKQMGEDYMKTGREAFLAAQQALTFKDAIEATSAAVKSKWADVFEALFGGLSKAKTMWTGLANDLWDIFAGGLDQRAKALKGANLLGGQDIFIDGLANIWENLYNIITAVQEAFRAVFPPKTAQQWADLAIRFDKFTRHLKLTDDGLENLKKTAKGFFSIFKIVGKVIGALIGPFFNFKTKGADAFRDGVEGILERTAVMGDAINNFARSPGFKTFLSKTRKVMSKVASIIKTTTKHVLNFVSSLKLIFLSENPISAFFSTMIEGAKDATLYVIDLFGNITGIDVSGVKEKVEEFFGTVRERAKEARDVLKNFGEKFGEIFGGFIELARERGVVAAIGETISKMIEEITLAAIDLFGAITGIDVSGAKENVSGFFETVRERAQAVIDVIKEVKDQFGKLFGTKLETDPETFERLTGSFKEFAGGAFIGSQTATGIETVVQGFISLFGAVTGADVSTATENVHNFFDKARDIAEKAGAKIQEFIDKIKGVYDTVKQYLVDAFAEIKKGMQQNRADKEEISLEDYIEAHPGQTMWDMITEDISAGWEKFKAAVGPVFEQIGTWIHDNIGGFDAEGLETLRGNFEKIAKFFSEVGDKIKETWDKISPTLEEVWEGIKDFFTKLGAWLKKKPEEVQEGMEQAGEAVEEGGGIDTGKLIKLAAALGVGILVAGLVKKLFDIVGMLNPITFMSKVKTMIEGFGDLSNSLSTGVKVAVFLSFASAVSMLVNSLLKLINIPEDKLTKGGMAIGGFISALFGSEFVTSKLNFNSSAKQIASMALMMVAIGVGVNLLVKAMMAFTSVPADQIESYVLALAEITAVLAGAIFIMGKANFKDAGLANLAKMAIAGGVLVAGVSKLAKVVVLLGQLPEDKLQRGTDAVMKLSAVVAVFFLALGYLNDKAAKKKKATDKTLWKNLAAFAGIIVALAALVASFTLAANVFSKMDENQFNHALVGMLVIIGSLALVFAGLMALTTVDADGSKVVKVAGAMAIASTALLVAAASIMLIKDADPMTAAVAAGSLAAMVLAVAGAMAIIAKQDISAGKLFAVAGSMAIVMGSLAAVALALSGLAKYSWGSILAAAGAITMVFAIMVAALTLVTASKGVSGGKIAAVAASMLLMSASILVIAAALKSLSGVDPDGLKKSLVGLGLALAGIVVAGVIANAAAPGFAVLAATLLAFGTAVLMAGAGVYLVGDGLAKISEVLTDLSDPKKLEAMSNIIDLLISKIPAFANAIFEVLFVTLPAAIIRSAGGLTLALVTVIDSVMNGLLMEIPKFVDAVVVFLIGILHSVNEHAVELVRELMVLLCNVLVGINAEIGTIVHNIIDIFVSICLAIGEDMERIIRAIFVLLLQAINGLATVIEQKAGDFYEAVKNLVTAIIHALITILTNLWEDVKTAVSKLANSAFVEKIREKTAAAKEAVGNIFKKMKAKIEQWKAKIKQAVQNVMKKFIQPIIDFKNKVKDKIKEMIDKALNFLKKDKTKDDWKDAGKDMILGLLNGIKEMAEGIWDAVTGIAEGALDAFKTFFKINSPSRVMRAQGEYLGEGLALGIEDSTGLVEDSMEAMGKDSLMAMDDALQAAYDLIDEDIDPTITPVLDLSKVQSGMNQMNGLFGSRKVSLDGASNAVNSTRSNGMSDLANTIRGLKTNTENNSISINVYGAEGQDVNELADAVVNRINSQLNRRKAVFA